MHSDPFYSRLFPPAERFPFDRAFVFLGDACAYSESEVMLYMCTLSREEKSRRAVGTCET